MRPVISKLLFVFILPLLAFFPLSCAKKDPLKDGRIVVTYWEKWNGFEGECMKDVVNRFNASQSKYFVNMVSISEVDRKMLVATAAGQPPDIGGIWGHNLAALSEKGALTDLTPYFKEAGISEKDFLPSVWEGITLKGKVWAMISVEWLTALHWNKTLFKAAGLNPDAPPKTIQELSELSDKLTLFEDKNGSKTSYSDLAQKYGSHEKATDQIAAQDLKLVQIGFLPSEPGWWNGDWGYYFGGGLFKAPGTITANCKENIEAYTWVQSFAKRYGQYNILRFASGFGQYSSPQNAFFSSKVALELHGGYLNLNLMKYAPGIEWAMAPFPTTKPELYGLTFAGFDVLVIPKGARHPEGAFEFFKFLAKQENAEKLAKNFGTFSYLSTQSPEFYTNHIHPYIRLFRSMAESKNYYIPPQIGTYREYARDMNEAFDRVWKQGEDPKLVLDDVQASAQRAYETNQKILKQAGKL